MGVVDPLHNDPLHSHLSHGYSLTSYELNAPENLKKWKTLIWPI